MSDRKTNTTPPLSSSGGLDQSVSRRTIVSVALLFVFALSLRLYRLDAFSMWGDEYHSIRQAQELGLSFNAPYYAFLRFWTTLGESDFFLRLPTALLGALVAPVVYFTARILFRSDAHACVAGVLAALSAVAVEFSQLVRFYSLFLLAASLAYLAFVNYLCLGRSPRRLGLLIAANLLCCTTHALGVVVTITQLASYWVFRSRNQRRAVALGTVGLATILLLPHVLSSDWLRVPFEFVQQYQRGDTPAVYDQPRGLQWTTIAKVPFALYVMTVGNSVYPRSLLAFAAIGLVGYLVMFSFFRGRLQEPQSNMLHIWLWTPLLMVFIGFDSWVARGFVGADLRHIIFALIPWQLVIAHAIVTQPRFLRRFVGAAILFVGLLSLGNHYYPQWSRTGLVPDWREANAFLLSSVGQPDLILHDGMSLEGINRYFSSTSHTRNLYQLDASAMDDTLQDVQRLAVVSARWRPEHRRRTNRILREIDKGFCGAGDYVDYPLFVKTYRRHGNSSCSTDRGSGRANKAPTEVFGIPFSDLRLPRNVRVAGEELKIQGNFSLGDDSGEQSRHILLSERIETAKLIVVTNLVGGGELAVDAAAAEIYIDGADGSQQRFLMRNGRETGDWNGSFLHENSVSFNSVFSWQKRMAIVGRSAYPNALQDFPAHTFGAEFRFDRPMRVQAITWRHLLDRGSLYVWGLKLSSRTA
jgi:hypothetical protein